MTTPTTPMPVPTTPGAREQHPAAGDVRHPGRKRWILAGAALAAVVLALVAWLLWRGWVPSAPGGLAAGPPSASSVTLTWSPSTSGPQTERYLVVRNADELGSVAAPATAYTDTTAVPDTTYRYTVVAVSGSKRSDPAPEVVVHTLPATPAGLDASTLTATSLTLTWSLPTRGPVPESWVVLRDDTEVGTVTGTTTSFPDSRLAPSTRYTYRLIASSGTLRSAPSSPLAATTLPATPSGLRASARTTRTITVGWGYSGANPQSFTVLRDGQPIATVGGAVRSHVDTGLVPATSYAYTVVAVTDGVRSAEPAQVRARTMTPALADGRLQGSYDVTGKVTKATTGIRIGSSAAKGQQILGTWTIRPKCSSGACDAVLSGGLAGHPFTMTLVRKGAVYTGTTRAHVSHCTGLATQIDVRDTLAVQLRVKTAGLESNVWTARSWSATLRVTSPYTSAGSSGLIRYYCPAGSLTAALTGSR